MKGAANTIAKYNSKVIPALCKILKDMPEAKRNTLIYNARDRQSRDLANWWENHQLIDKERIQRETIRKKQKAIRQAALAKLTIEERKILGF